MRLRLPVGYHSIVGDLRQGKNVLVVAHGNSNRSIVMALEKMTPEQIIKVNLDTGVPYLYEVDEKGQMLGKKSLT